ncbi:MAG: helix-turn-helix domain-containing protein [Haloarculaceae archaeon]
MVVAGLLAVGTAGYWRATRGSGAADGATAPGPSGGGSPPVDDDGGPGEGDGGVGDDDSARDGTRAAAGAVDPSPVVTDEERVRELLDEHGGQLKQSDIVEAFDWSKSKTSRVLSDMAEEGAVEKLRIGRENVIRLQSGQSDDHAGETE